MLVQVKSAEKAYKEYCKAELNSGEQPVTLQEYIENDKQHFGNIYKAVIKNSGNIHFNIVLLHWNDNTRISYDTYWTKDELEEVKPKFKDIMLKVSSKTIDGILCKTTSELPKPIPGTYFVLPIEQYALLNSDNRYDIVTKIGDSYVSKFSC